MSENSLCIITDPNDENIKFSHKFILEKPYKMTCISRDLLDLLGYSKDEIYTVFNDTFLPMVYPDDRKQYLKYIEELASSEQTMTLHYRLVRKHGEVRYVNDISFSHKKSDGKMYGFSMIADVTDSIRYSSLQTFFRMPANTIPFGYLQCTCEKYPKVLYINERLMYKLCKQLDNKEWKEFLSENIFFMIPYEDRDIFRSFLDKALHSADPIRIEHHLLDSNGQRFNARGWISTILNHEGNKEYSIIYTDLDHAGTSSSPLSNSYYKALESAYNVIFEANLVNRTVECLHGRETSDIGKLADVHMTIESAMHFWVNNYIIPEDRKEMLEYLMRITNPGEIMSAERPLSCEFKIIWDDQKIYSFIGVAVKLDNASILFCCRDTSKVQFSGYQARETHALKKLHRLFDKHYIRDKNAIGAVIFEKTAEEDYDLIYASPQIINFYGLREDQYVNYLENGLTKEEIEEFSSKAGIHDVEKLLDEKKMHTVLENGTSLDLTCQYMADTILEIIVYKDNVPSVIAGIPQKGVFARTFGFFDLFVDGVPIVFSNKKEKELMALLIDRNGGTLSSSEALSYLWENELPDDKLKARYRKLAMGLNRTLKSYGIEDILINKNGVRSVDTSRFLCDYYELLAGNIEYVHSFHNCYMTDYSWSERTLGTLWDFS